MKRVLIVLLACLVILTLTGFSSISTSTTGMQDKDIPEKPEIKADTQTKRMQNEENGLIKESRSKIASSTDVIKHDVMAFAQQDKKDGLSKGEEAPEDPEERIEKLRGIVQTYINREKFSFDYDEKSKAFFGDFKIENLMKVVEVRISIYDDMVSVRTAPIDWLVPKEARDKIASLATLYNNDHFYSYLMMDYEDGFVYSRSVQLVEEVLPTIAEIDVLVQMSLYAIEDSGDAILAISQKKADVFKEYKKILEKEDREYEEESKEKEVGWLELNEGCQIAMVQEN